MSLKRGNRLVGGETERALVDSPPASLGLGDADELAGAISDTLDLASQESSPPVKKRRSTASGSVGAPRSGLPSSAPASGSFGAPTISEDHEIQISSAPTISSAQTTAATASPTPRTKASQG